MIASLAGFIVVAAGWLEYLRRIPQEKVPRKPTLNLVAMYAGSLLAVGGLLTGPSLALSAAFALPALANAGFFLFLLRQAPQPDGDLKAKIGDRLLPFSAKDSDGNPFSSASLEGRRVLLKFFRGHW